MSSANSTTMFGLAEETAATNDVAAITVFSIV